MNIAIIPARSGSQRIKNKNIKLFSKKPIIYWTIKILKEANLFDAIAVSSDSNKILEFSKKYGSDILIKRPKRLSDSKTSTHSAIKHAIKFLNLKSQNNLNIFCVYPCNPLLQISDLKKSLLVLKKNKNKFIFPVSSSSNYMSNLIILNKSKNVKYVKNYYKKKYFFDAGQFYLGNLSTWKKFSNIHKNGHCIKIPEWRTVDINYPNDWKKAEAIFRYLNNVSR